MKLIITLTFLISISTSFSQDVFVNTDKVFSGTYYGYKTTYPGELTLTITDENINLKISGETGVWLHDVEKLDTDPELPNCESYLALDKVMNAKVEVRICSEKAFTLKYTENFDFIDFSGNIKIIKE